MKVARLLPAATALLLPLVFSACSSSKGAQSGAVADNEKMGPTMAQRMGKWDMGKRSNFEKSLGTAGANKGFKTSNFHRQKDFKTGAEYSRSDDKFNTKGFAQSDKTSSVREQTFSGADDRSKLGDARFKTKDSGLSHNSVHDADKTSSHADDVFRTFDNRMGTKGLENSKRPLIEDQPGQYTEGQIRNLLNKG